MTMLQLRRGFYSEGDFIFRKIKMSINDSVGYNIRTKSCST